jgi:hypothetical protein
MWSSIFEWKSIRQHEVVRSGIFSHCPILNVFHATVILPITCGIMIAMPIQLNSKVVSASSPLISQSLLVKTSGANNNDNDKLLIWNYCTCAGDDASIRRYSFGSTIRVLKMQLGLILCTGIIIGGISMGWSKNSVTYLQPCNLNEITLNIYYRYANDIVYSKLMFCTGTRKAWTCLKIISLIVDSQPRNMAEVGGARDYNIP